MSSSMAPEQSVIVVGAGPTGLTLACELAAAGVACTVLERRAAPADGWRSVTLYSRTLEVLQLRGHAEDLAAAGRPVDRMTVGSAPSIDFSGLDSPYPFVNVIPQSRTEEVLERRALDLGVTLQREAEVTELRRDGEGVTLRVRTPAGEWDERARYVVGCDGAGSAVRELAGIAFRGHTYAMAPLLADVRLRRPLPRDLLVLPGRGGIVVSVPYADGSYRLAVVRGGGEGGWRDEEATPEEFRARLAETLGHDPEPHEVRWLARFKIHQRIADRYRAGRVLLAGDAAHLHSPLGGQGLNLGIQDAVNLGWKLAAEVRGWAAPGLLDSYEAERRPQAERTLAATDRATRLAAATSPGRRLARRGALVRLRSARNRRRAAEVLTGLDTDYGSGVRGKAPHPGGRLPHVTVPLPGRPRVPAGELMRDGRFLLLDASADGAGAELAEPWGDRVCAVRAGGPLPGLPGVAVLLVRPDAHLAWTTSGPDPAGLRAALLHHCGPADSPSGQAGQAGPSDAARGREGGVG
ncbi:FAD-dependent oxidoreductase [Streptomyces sp. JJ38]|uniref:FAD-dependent oxidoreductase n=1 Tax=Streptomyces sp. JJ38 TaxID=2738128 RepID=UPI001C57F3D8|nr:FAD-dependent oxidoreductase [Streptomyces sp. JJ38]MBW1596831.1 FAD-dependent oxidoreductase [Streptomyces sp. JJ38]